MIAPSLPEGTREEVVPSMVRALEMRAFAASSFAAKSALTLTLRRVCRSRSDPYDLR